MQRGKRKSPFIGASEAVGSQADPILYFRYNNLSDILLEGSVPPPATQNGDVPAKKKPKREKVKKPKPEVENGAQQQQKQQKKKPSKPKKLAPEERVSGPGNANEALKIREALGFVAQTPEEVAAAEAAARRAAAQPTFAFGFSLGAAAGSGAAAVVPAAVAKPAGRPVKGGREARRGGGGSSSSSSGSDSESSGSESDSEPEQAGGSSSDSESEDDRPAWTLDGHDSPGSSSEEDGSDKAEDGSSSDSEEESEEEQGADGNAAALKQGEAGAPPAAAARSQQLAAAAPAAGAPAGAGGGQQGGGEDEEDGEFVPRRMYAGGMPFSYSEGQVHEYWSYCGEIESMDLMTFPDTGRFRGIVFVTFATQEGFEAALACDGEQCDGQTLKVQKCKWSPKERAARQRQRQRQQQQVAQQPQQQQAAPVQKQEQRQEHPQGLGSNGHASPAQQQQPNEGAGRRQHNNPAPKTEGYNVAYVGNIAFEADEKELQRLFDGYGVTKIRLHTDKDTGRSKGFAHVHFKDAESLDRALQLNGTQLHGRRMKMGYAQPKKDQ